ncbi:MAG TPA: hypothetical protein VNL95_04560 [Dehalococcoidia bacterium]|nr:hypothetical protein [Dehalococcoidia bacterium]
MPRAIVRDPELGELGLAEARTYLYLDGLTCARCGGGAHGVVWESPRRAEPMCWRCADRLGVDREGLSTLGVP